MSIRSTCVTVLCCGCKHLVVDARRRSVVLIWSGFTSCRHELTSRGCNRLLVYPLQMLLRKTWLTWNLLTG